MMTQMKCPLSDMVVLTPLDSIKENEFFLFGPAFDEDFAEIVHAIHLTYTEELKVFSWSSGKYSNSSLQN